MLTNPIFFLNNQYNINKSIWISVKYGNINVTSSERAGVVIGHD